MAYKRFLKNYFHYLSYFYGYLKHRIFISLGVSLMVGLLDGIGLALFIPLLKLISTNSTAIDTIGDKDVISDFVINTLKIVPSLLNIFLLIFLFFSLKGIAKFIESYLRVIYQQIFMRKIRVSNIDLLSQFEFQSFITSDTGRIQNTFGGEINRLNSAYNHYFKSIQLGVLVGVYLILAFGSNWKFTFLVILGGGFVNLIFKFLYKRTVYFSKKYTKKTHVFQNLLIQKVHLFKYLKATGQNVKYGEKLKNNIYDLEQVQKRLGVIDAILGAVREPLSILVIFLAIFLNIYFFNEKITSIMLSLLLLYRSISFFMIMQEQWNAFLGVSGSLENMKEFTKSLESNQEINGSVALDGFKSFLTMQGLDFKFKNGYTVLKDINLEIVKNETIAIIGESGSGKSTLMNVISGLLKPTSGTYLVDGINVEDLDLLSFKKQLGYIVQDATIFNDTIYNNISFWAPKTLENLNKFERAVKKSAISKFILELPDKEDTVIGSNGINISGGQRQRLSIARELFKDVDILLLDEATSSLDSETENEIQSNINALKGQYTIIIIAHRLATIKNADRILLMKNGTINAIGNFEALLKSSISFREMVQNQNL
ncbi:ABC transporter ATP-binding protein [Gillisia sp. CAL575]|uniref:ABC transporter ATP-binding protein n=1 Tax=Gillisia sp. CAL575 TaxID=985255 RepID=UPI0005580850|nr:ABC transporter ATP-binding protein [Gillisia sp. CAL575]